jgi:SOS-response transcriptional repressor LexA
VQKVQVKMSKQGLTPRQSDIYRFLVAYHKEYGVYPSMREIAEGKIEGEQVITKVSASSAVKLTLDRLESRGWIRKGKHIPRGLEVL